MIQRQRPMRRFQVSRSFVIAVALADYFGVEEQEQFTRKRGK